MDNITLYYMFKNTKHNNLNKTMSTTYIFMFNVFLNPKKTISTVGILCNFSCYGFDNKTLPTIISNLK